MLLMTGLRVLLSVMSADRKSFPKSHDTWSNLRNWKKSSFIELEEIGAVKEYAEEHGGAFRFAIKIALIHRSARGKSSSGI